jgi:Flp pilus assembly protein TadG
MGMRNLCVAVRHLLGARDAGAAVEFALVSFAYIGFLLAILNLGMLGFSLAALTHGVQQAARTAATYAANQEVTNSTYACPSASTIAEYFNTYADPPLSPAGTTSASNPYITATWINNATGSVTTEPPGLYLTLVGTYKWKPLGLAAFGSGINLNIATVATVMGTSTGTPSIATSCGT